MNIVAYRLFNQHLLNNSFESIEDVVRHFGAVQAQDYSGASWGISLRMKKISKSDFDAPFNDGMILRTHVLRPTWHFVLSEDILWMTELTAPRINQAMAYYNRKLELDVTFFAKSNRIITSALSDKNFLTRTEIAAELAKRGIEVSGQRLGHIMMQAEIDGLICSGPLRGKQFTYASIADRAPNAKKLNRDESLALLARRYFTSHGPATQQDFTWWSGLTVSEAKKALDSVKKEFESETFSGKEYWFKADSINEPVKPHILLMSVYDEYVIAYKDYDPIFIDKTKSLSNIFGNAQLAYVVIKDGQIVGTWSRKIGAKKISIELKLKVELNQRYQKLLHIESERYGKFFGLPVEISIK